MAIFACKTTTGSIEVTERGHGEVAILVDELGEVTAIDSTGGARRRIGEGDPGARRPER